MALIGLALHNIHVSLIRASHERDIVKAQQEIIKQCEEDKQLTQEVSSEFQTQISNLNRRLADLKRVRKPACIPVTSSTSRCDATSRDGYVKRNGIDTRTLFDYAGLAEKYRLQLISCQSFVNKTWKEKSPAR